MLSSFITSVCDAVLYVSCILILLGSIILSIRTRFVQIRLLPDLFRTLKKSFHKKTEEGSHTIRPAKALFTAMSTTLGIGTIVGPVIAINLGGPGALLGFLLTAFFGSAATYVEVNLSVASRVKLPSGQIMGGPMQYLKRLVSPKLAKWYAGCCFLLMMAWSSAQANQLSSILNSPLLGNFRIPAALSGSIIALIVFFLLIGGIKKIGAVEAKLVPIKFILYVGSCLFILGMNVSKLGEVFSLIFSSAFSPYAMASGTVVGGLMSSLRWGIFKGTQICEAGVGTQTIPHSMAETNDPEGQASLAMLSTYAAGFVAFLSGCVAIVTDTWQDPNLPLGISMVAASFKMYFASLGVIAVASCAVIFAFGTILGNGYNGSQALGYLTQNKKLHAYYAATAISIFLGAVLDAKTVWAFSDLILAAMAIPHMGALVLHVLKKPLAHPQST